MNCPLISAGMVYVMMPSTSDFSSGTPDLAMIWSLSLSHSQLRPSILMMALAPATIASGLV